MKYNEKREGVILSNSIFIFCTLTLVVHVSFCLLFLPKWPPVLCSRTGEYAAYAQPWMPSPYGMPYSPYYGAPYADHSRPASEYGASVERPSSRASVTSDRKLNLIGSG